MTNYPVQVWEYAGYGGHTALLGYGSYSNVNQLGMPDNSITAVKVAPFTCVVLYAGFNYAGDSVRICGPIEIYDLRDYLGGILQDRTSSIIVSRIEPTIDTKFACCQSNASAYSCGEYVPNTPACDQATANYCNYDYNMRDARCQTWCRSHTADCDIAVNNYCAAYPADPYCTCINSPAQVRGVINPKCVDKKCLDTGYLTTTMNQTQCPAQVNCEVQNVLQNSGIVLSNTVPVQQNCGGTTAPPTIIDDTTTGFNETILIYILIFIIVIAFAILIYFIINGTQGVI